MIRGLILTGVLGAAMGSAPPAWSAIKGVSDPARAKVNYMLNCQGCHGPEGLGTADGAVPNMAAFLGRFLRVTGGRDYLVRVPGSANAAISDSALAELLNWMLEDMAGTDLPAQFLPYTPEEVARLRSMPLADPAVVRERLLSKMEAK